MIRFILTFLILNISAVNFAQEKTITIKSNSEKVKIIEGEEIRNWILDSKIKPKIYTTGKNVHSKNIKITTGIDSLEVNIKPNQIFDFVVLLNEKDSCFTRIESPEIVDFSNKKPLFKNKIPFEITSFNNIKVKSILNNQNTLELTFDTGAFDFSLTRDAIKKYLNPNNLKLTMEDISDNTFDIGDFKWEHQQIYPIETTGHFTEGMFGWNIFDGKILEINYDKNTMIVYSKLPKISKDYEKFDMELMRYHFCIAIEIESENVKYKSRYLFDTGFQKAIMLDHDLLTQMDYPTDKLEIIKSSILHNSQNEEIPVKTVKIEKLIFGKYVLENIPAEINNYNKPARYSTNFLGSDILKRFNIILDFQKNIVYMKPNKYFYDEYMN